MHRDSMVVKLVCQDSRFIFLRVKLFGNCNDLGVHLQNYCLSLQDVGLQLHYRILLHDDACRWYNLYNRWAKFVPDLETPNKGRTLSSHRRHLQSASAHFTSTQTLPDDRLDLQRVPRGTPPANRHGLRQIYHRHQCSEELGGGRAHKQPSAPRAGC